MSDNMPNPTDWVQIYQNALSRPSPPPSPQPLAITTSYGLSEAVTVTAAPTSSSTSPSPPLYHHNPMGRGSRLIRRRSRASRRTPTTIFNTDTKNFRAMVEQFTGNQTQPVQSQRPVQFFGPRNIDTVYNIPFQQQVQQNQQQVQQNLLPQGQIGEIYFFGGSRNTSSSRSNNNNMEISGNLIMESLPHQRQ